LSARWRRSQRSKKFDIFKVFKKTRTKHVRQTSPKGQRIKWKSRPRKCKLQTVSVEKELKEPKPLIDILEDDNKISVIAEFAGFNREDLRIDVKEQRLILSAEALDRKYHKSLNLPRRVIPSTLCTTYKNGVLEIRLKKVATEKAMDKVAG
jgi:HSP20 family molecular chaperone IbpA